MSEPTHNDEGSPAKPDDSMALRPSGSTPGNDPANHAPPAAPVGDARARRRWLTAFALIGVLGLTATGTWYFGFRPIETVQISNPRVGGGLGLSRVVVVDCVWPNGPDPESYYFLALRSRETGQVAHTAIVLKDGQTQGSFMVAPPFAPSTARRQTGDFDVFVEAQPIARPSGRVRTSNVLNVSL